MEEKAVGVHKIEKKKGSGNKKRGKKKKTP